MINSQLAHATMGMHREEALARFANHEVCSRILVELWSNYSRIRQGRPCTSAIRIPARHGPERHGPAISMGVWTASAWAVTSKGSSAVGPDSAELCVCCNTAVCSI